MYITISFRISLTFSTSIKAYFLFKPPAPCERFIFPRAATSQREIHLASNPRGTERLRLFIFDNSSALYPRKPTKSRPIPLKAALTNKMQRVCDTQKSGL